MTARPMGDAQISTRGFPMSTRLVLFPGLGADGRLFEPQRRGLPADVQIETPPWIEPLSIDETVESYLRRMAERVSPPREGERLFLGGVSFGAIVALEAATRSARHAGGVHDRRLPRHAPPSRRSFASPAE